MAGHSIAVFCHNLEINGANNFIFMLASTLRREGSVAIFSPREGNMRERFERLGLAVHVVPESFEFDALRRFDAVFVNSLMMSRVALECVQRKVPHILIVHETWAPENISYYLNDLWKIDGVTAEEILAALRTSQHVVFPARYLERVYEALVDRERHRTIYNTIDMKRFDAYLAMHSKDNARRDLGLPEDRFVFIQVGTISRRKAQLATLEAFCLMRKRQKFERKCALLFVGARSFRRGEQEYVEQIRRVVDREGVSDVVRIYEVQEDIPKFFRAADVLIHPSINEVLPLVVLEGCYCGLPAIVSNLDGMPEVIRDGVEGLLVNPYNLHSIADAMQRFADDPSWGSELGQNARRKVAQQHEVECFAARYRDLFDSVVKFHQRGPAPETVRDL